MISACNHVRSRSLVPAVPRRWRKNRCLKRGKSVGCVLQRGCEERLSRIDASWEGERDGHKSCFDNGKDSSGGGTVADVKPPRRLSTYAFINGSHSTPGGFSNNSLACSLHPAATKPRRYPAQMTATCRLTMPLCTCARFEVDSADVVYLV